MDLHPDFRELPALLNSHSVEYLIVGGYAVAFHGARAAAAVGSLTPEEATATR